MHAGRTFSRKSRRRGRAGRVLSRKSRRRGGVGRTFSRQAVLRRSCRRRGALLAHFRLVAVGVLHYTKPSCGVSPACRTPVSCNSPRLAAARPRVEGGVAAKVQTHWAKIAENGLFWLNGSALWRNWRVWTHRLRYSALRARRMRVGSGSWAPLLAPVTR